MSAPRRDRFQALREIVSVAIAVWTVVGATGCGSRVDGYRPGEEDEGSPPPDGYDSEGSDEARPHVQIVDEPAIDSWHTFAVRLWNAGHRNGTYGAWCVDRRTTSASGPYPVDLFSDPATLPPETVAVPERLELVNYVLNTFPAGATIDVSAPTGEATWPAVIDAADIQDALWALVEGADSPAETGYGSPTAVAIVQSALIDGPGFVPQCGDELALVAVPRTYVDPVEGNESQILAVVLPFSAGDCP